MALHGLDVPPERVRHCSFRRDHAVQEARALLELADRPTAVFAANNILAEACFLAADDLGLRIPAEVSLIAFDDMPWMSLTAPKVTAIRQPVSDMARTATELVLRRLRAEAGDPSTIVFQPQLVERGSVASPGSRGRRGHVAMTTNSRPPAGA
jgi:LacI family transcriptional regulator